VAKAQGRGTFSAFPRVNETPCFRLGVKIGVAVYPLSLNRGEPSSEPDRIIGIVLEFSRRWVRDIARGGDWYVWGRGVTAGFFSAAIEQPSATAVSELDIEGLQESSS
jgi:hypothetical protein